MKDFLEKIIEVTGDGFWVIIKNVLLVFGFLIGIGLNYDAVQVLFWLMMIDMLFGIADSAVTEGWHSITSARFGRGVVAKLMILSLPGVLLYAGFGANHDFSQITNGFMTALIFSEVYSILGHVVAVNTGEKMKEFDAVSFVLKKLRNALKLIITDEKSNEK